jgi:hypothetical protein
MRLRDLAGWRGIVAGIVLVILGFWAFTYTCNTEVAACKGAEPWPGAMGYLNAAGWVVALLGLVLIVVAVVAWIVRAVRDRSRAPRSPQTSDR